MSGSTSTLSFTIDSSQASAAVQVLQQLYGASVLAADGAKKLAEQERSTQENHAAYGRELTGNTDATNQLNFAQKQLSRTLYETSNDVVALTNKLREQQTMLVSSSAALSGYASTLQQLTNVGKLIGQSANDLQSFVNVADRLNVPANNVAVALNRITAALENQTSAGLQARQVIERYGVSLAGLGVDQASSVLQRFTEAARQQAPSAELTRNVGLIYGNVNGQDLAGMLGPQPYISRDTKIQRQQEDYINSFTSDIEGRLNYSKQHLDYI
jgi:hypothetical protein